MLQNTVIPGVMMWSRWQPDRSMNFNSFYVMTKDGSENVLVDPLALDDEDA